MNEEEKQAFFGCFQHLQHHKTRLRDFITLLSLNDVITTNDCISIKKSIKKLDLEIIKDIPNHCSKDRLLRCLKMNRKLYTRFKNKLCKTHSPVLTPQSMSPTGTNETYINNFYEVLKAKALRNGKLEWSADFERWANQLSSTLQVMPYGTDKRNVADCFFVLLDLQAVIEKQHVADKSHLWMRPVFQTMERVIGETSNPSLSRLIFQSRKGTAYAQSSQYEEALKYASLVLCDVAMFSSGKQVGSCIFAVVNMFLQYYSYLCAEHRIAEALDLKRQILHWIEVGYLQFVDEDSDIKKTWRRVYLDKTTYCHLGIDILSRDIPGALIAPADIEKANHCIIEMMELRDGMERMRLLHLNFAQAKMYRLEGRLEVANGYYKETLKLAEEGKFLSEVEVLKEYLSISSNTNAQEHSLDSGSRIHVTTSSSTREASENEDTSSYGDENSETLQEQKNEEDPVELENIMKDIEKTLLIK